MPKYELMYIIGNQISDNQIPQVTDEVKKFIEADGGIVEKHEELGKKKLAYPIRQMRNGYYVVVNFQAPAEKVSEIEHKIRTSPNLVRHIVLSMDAALIRMEKDRKVQAKLFRPKELGGAKKSKPLAKKPEQKIQIDLDAEIEKALGAEDLK